jgi:hypothetical protein
MLSSPQSHLIQYTPQILVKLPQREKKKGISVYTDRTLVRYMYPS